MSESEWWPKCGIFNSSLSVTQANATNFLTLLWIHLLYCEVKVTSFWGVCISSQNAIYHHRDVSVTHFPRNLTRMWKEIFALVIRYCHKFVDSVSRCGHIFDRFRVMMPLHFGWFCVTVLLRNKGILLQLLGKWVTQIKVNLFINSLR